jgi:hypothetical protein
MQMSSSAMWIVFLLIGGGQPQRSRRLAGPLPGVLLVHLLFALEAASFATSARPPGLAPIGVAEDSGFGMPNAARLNQAAAGWR